MTDPDYPTTLAEDIRDLSPVVPENADECYGQAMYRDGFETAREAAAKLAEQHHATVLRLRHAALWLASNPPGTPVPEWVDAAVNDPALVASGDGAELAAGRLPGVEVTYEVQGKGPLGWCRWSTADTPDEVERFKAAWHAQQSDRELRVVEVTRRPVGREEGGEA